VDELLKAAHAAVKREEWIKSWQLCNAALNQDPDRPEALYLMGATLREMGNLGLAYQCLRRSVAQEQRQVNLWMTYAATLHDLNKWDEAREAMKVAHKMAPKDPMPLANIGATYLQQGKWRDALEWGYKALEIDPDCHVARISNNFAHLSMGRWMDAWKDAKYLYGKHLPLRVYNPPEHEEPMWDGTKGQTVVVQADQGVGDILMFSQMLPQLAKDCKTVILECAPRLVNLMRRNFPEIQVVGTLKEENQEWAAALVGTENQIDAHVHISYLGNWYRNKDSDFPRQSYLTADPKKVEQWKEYLTGFPKPWVGIAWKGGIQATQTHLRSMDLKDLAQGITKGTMVDLSYQDNRLEVSRWNIDNPIQVISPDINTEDYENTVALIAALDEVVTVTTTVAHVCGSLGKKCSVLVPSVPQWRYAYRCGDGTSMIWYPENSVRLCRQNHGEDWKYVVKRATECLTA
jgi:tetratricopeptide (TPR) repeat protein